MLEQIKQPEYTGSNRCIPCTIVNSIIALGLGGAVAVFSPLAGAAVVLVSAVLIYLRGYLVPGTPTLTKRYMPAPMLRLFGKEPESPDGITMDAGEDEEIEDLDVEAYLHRVGAIEPCPDRDDDCLVEAFGREWDEEMAAIREREDLAAVVLERIDVSADEYEIQEHDDARILLSDGEQVGKWPSRAALVADTAAAAVLADRSDQWDALGTMQRGHVLRALRIFLDTCPTSDGPVTMGEETVESCCSTREVVAVTCSDSGARLFEQPLPE